MSLKARKPHNGEQLPLFVQISRSCFGVGEFNFNLGPAGMRRALLRREGVTAGKCEVEAQLIFFTDLDPGDGKWFGHRRVGAPVQRVVPVDTIGETFFDLPVLGQKGFLAIHDFGDHPTQYDSIARAICSTVQLSSAFFGSAPHFDYSVRRKNRWPVHSIKYDPVFSRCRSFFTIIVVMLLLVGAVEGTPVR